MDCIYADESPDGVNGVVGGGPGGMAATAPPIAIAPGSSTTGGVFASATMFGRGFRSSAKNNSRTNGSVAWQGQD